MFQIRAHCAPDCFGATLLRSGLNIALDPQRIGIQIHSASRLCRKIVCCLVSCSDRHHVVESQVVLTRWFSSILLGQWYSLVNSVTFVKRSGTHNMAQQNQQSSVVLNFTRHRKLYFGSASNLYPCNTSATQSEWWARIC